MAMFPTNTQYKQVVKTISYAAHEKTVLDMEDALMKKHGYNRSALHKTLVRDQYRRENTAL